MRLVIVTGRRPHHKNLCAKLAGAHNVVGIIHPVASTSGTTGGLRKLFLQIKRNGASLVLLRILRRLPAGGPGGVFGSNRSPIELPDFSAGEKEYGRMPRELIHDSCDVKSPETHALVRALRPDVAVCLGGPIYPMAFIDSCPLMLNFHSGVSPIYNGASSAQFAFANGHVQFCGGTLMVISASVDGGGIIGHYLPSIQAGDTPETLFQKTVAGTPGMYERLLDSLDQQPRPLTSIPQPRPLFHTRDVDFGWHLKAMIACQRRRNVTARFQRSEKAVEYWRAPDAVSARKLYKETIETLLWE